METNVHYDTFNNDTVISNPVYLFFFYEIFVCETIEWGYCATIFARRFLKSETCNTARLRILASSDKARSGSSRIPRESRLIYEVVLPQACARESPPLQLQGSQRCETSSKAWARLLHASSPFLESIAATLSNDLRSTWSGHFSAACFGTSLSAPNNNIHGCFSTSSKEARAVGSAWSICCKRSLQPFCLSDKQRVWVWEG